MQRLVPGRLVAGAAGEQRQAALQAGQERRRRQEPAPGGGQLDRQRQAVEPPADRFHRRRVRLVQRESGAHRLGALGEQAHGVGAERVVLVLEGWSRRDGALRVGPGRYPQRRHLEGVLCGEPQHRPAGDQHGEARAGRQQVRQRQRGRQHVLEVVQHQQQALGAEEVSQQRQGRPIAGAGEAQRRRQGGEHQRRIFERRQGDEDRAVAEGGEQARRRPEGQAGLAHAARAGEGEQAHAPARQPVADRRHLPLPADEGRRRDRQRPDRRARPGTGAGGQRPRAAAAVHRRLQLVALGRRQAQRPRQEADGVSVRRHPLPRFEGAHGAGAQPGRLRQRLLRQAGGHAEPAQPVAEAGSLVGGHRPAFRSRPARAPPGGRGGTCAARPACPAGTRHVRRRVDRAGRSCRSCLSSPVPTEQTAPEQPRSPDAGPRRDTGEAPRNPRGRTSRARRDEEHLSSEARRAPPHLRPPHLRGRPRDRPGRRPRCAGPASAGPVGHRPGAAGRLRGDQYSTAGRVRPGGARRDRRRRRDGDRREASGRRPGHRHHRRCTAARHPTR